MLTVNEQEQRSAALSLADALERRDKIRSWVEDRNEDISDLATSLSFRVETGLGSGLTGYRETMDAVNAQVRQMTSVLLDNAVTQAHDAVEAAKSRLVAAMQPPVLP